MVFAQLRQYRTSLETAAVIIRLVITTIVMIIR